MYRFFRWFLFRVDAEGSHDLALKSLKYLHRWGFLAWITPIVEKNSKTWFGIRFPNSLGLAAGLDKNGDYIEALSALGFGFIEVGTITPRPQLGNPKPRLFRLPQAHAVINRMGFNSKGVDYFLEQVRRMDFQGVLGVNIGKNADTPLEKAKEDYLYCYERVYLYASYVVINISSPNTEGLRALQHTEYLDDLLSALVTVKKSLSERHHRIVPLLVKVSPDLSPDEIQAVAKSLTTYTIDGLIATNTTVSRQEVQGLPRSEEKGGLSGRPLMDKSNSVIAQFRQLLGPHFPIIGAGGIDSVKAAQEKLQAGANLIQIYTGLVYEGPGLIRRLLKLFST